MTPYGDKDLGQHLLRQWLVAWWHQAITWTNVDLSSITSSGIHLRAISQEMSQPSINKNLFENYMSKISFEILNDLMSISVIQPGPLCHEII